jgi:hypothetical protein
LKDEQQPEPINKKSSIVAYENNDKRMESVYSKRIRAGKRRTYFFDVRTTKGNDYYLTITESRKRFNDDGYDRHKIFLYKEDFNKFIKALDEAVTYVKTDLMPDFDFDAFNHDNEFEQEGDEETDIAPVTEQKIIQISLIRKNKSSNKPPCLHICTQAQTHAQTQTQAQTQAQRYFRQSNRKYYFMSNKQITADQSSDWRKI